MFYLARFLEIANITPLEVMTGSTPTTGVEKEAAATQQQAPPPPVRLPPTLPTLSLLQLAYINTIPFENASLLLARSAAAATTTERQTPGVGNNSSSGSSTPSVKLDLESLADKILIKRYGGYCFEHNTLFRAILREAGFGSSFLSSASAASTTTTAAPAAAPGSDRGSDSNTKGSTATRPPSRLHTHLGRVVTALTSVPPSAATSSGIVESVHPRAAAAEPPAARPAQSHMVNIITMMSSCSNSSHEDNNNSNNNTKVEEEGNEEAAGNKQEREERYMCDVGFGGVALTMPLKLVDGIEQRHGDAGYRLTRPDPDNWLVEYFVEISEEDENKPQQKDNTEEKNHESERQPQMQQQQQQQHSHHPLRKTILLYLFSDKPCEEIDLIVGNHFVSTFPTSPFLHDLKMARVIDGTQVNLQNRRITRYETSSSTTTTTTAAAAAAAVVANTATTPTAPRKRVSYLNSFEQFKEAVNGFFVVPNQISDEDMQTLYTLVKDRPC